jgi:ferredoxin--NADP+ reductase
MHSEHTRPLVAIFGGAVSGAEAAYQLSQQGVEVVVFDQNTLPYGKIEDGLPKWHVKLRDKEEARINEKLSHPLVHFVPLTRLGRDLDFEEVARQWGFSAILLAIGAWRDRPLPIEGVDAFIGKGLYYQNPFIYWFNHKHEPDYNGPQYDTPDGAIIVGGGLASLDVAKVIMFELVEKALRERGIETDLFALDRSIAKVLEDHQLTLNDLGVEGCTIYYRRRVIDMPLSPQPTDTPEQLAKAQAVREKILNNYQSKYLFKIEPCRAPVDKLVEDGRLAGLVFQSTRIEGERVIPIPGSETPVRAPLVISSIGSIPEHIDGLPMSGQVYRIEDESCCRVEGFDHVFAIGNAVTGRGNINESLKHGRQVTLTLLERYLSPLSPEEAAMRQAESAVGDKVKTISAEIQRLPIPSQAQRRAIFERVRQLRSQAGYDGDYAHWVEAKLPVRLEQLIGHE